MKNKLLLLLISLLLILSMVACDSQPPVVPNVDDTPPAQDDGKDENGGGETPSPEPEKPAGNWLNIATYNIVHCADQTDPDLMINPDNIVKVIKENDVDIIGLNEVDVNCARSQGWVTGEYHLEGSHQPKYIAEKLTEQTGEQYYWAFSASLDGCLTPAHQELGNGQYGNAIISKYPILSSRTLLVAAHDVDPDNPDTQRGDGYERRSMLLAEIDVKGTVITVIATHFGLKADERALAVQMLQNELNVIDTPVIFMGDLNDYYDSTIIKQLNVMLKPTSTASSPPSFVSSGKRIDYIFTSEDIATKDLKTVFVRYSDHYPVVVKAMLKEPTA